MNNRALVNLKQIMPVTGQAIVTSDFVIRPKILKPFGWHTLARIKVAKLVLQVKQFEEELIDKALKLTAMECLSVTRRDQLIADIRKTYRQRHNPPKGWKA